MPKQSQRLQSAGLSGGFQCSASEVGGRALPAVLFVVSNYWNYDAAEDGSPILAALEEGTWPDGASVLAKIRKSRQRGCLMLQVFPTVAPHFRRESESQAMQFGDLVERFCTLDLRIKFPVRQYGNLLAFSFLSSADA